MSNKLCSTIPSYKKQKKKLCLLGGGLRCSTYLSNLLKGGGVCLIQVVSFVLDQICDILDGVLVDISHKGYWLVLGSLDW